MLIVRYYQNGGFAAASPSRHPVMLVMLIPLPPGAHDANFRTSKQKKPTCQDNSGGGIQFCLN